MRVLLVANTLPPTDLSGVGEQVLQLAAGLRDRGHEVRVLGRGKGGARGPKLLFPVMIVVPMLRVLRQFRPDVVQVHESDAAFAALATRLTRRTLEPRPRLLALLQVSYKEERRAVRPLADGERILGRPGSVERRFRRWKAPIQIVLGRLTARQADLVLAPSRATAREIERDYGVNGVEVLPNVTGGLAHQQAQVEGGERRDSEGGYLLFVGRLRIRKGVEVLLHALHGLESATTEPPTRLWVVGDGEHRGALERLAARLDLGDRVSFLGRKPPLEVRRLLSEAAALVVPSTYEGMPLVVLEAMDSGIPVVASAVSGIPEVVVDGETGWLVPAEDVGALESALREVLTEPERARALGAGGRKRIETLYRPAHAAVAWQSLVGEHSGGKYAAEDRSR